MRGKKLVQLEETHRPTRQNHKIILLKQSGIMLD